MSGLCETAHDKAPLSDTLPPFPCQILKVPLCPDLEVACKPLSMPDWERANPGGRCCQVVRTGPGVQTVSRSLSGALGLLRRSQYIIILSFKGSHWTVSLPAKLKEPK